MPDWLRAVPLGVAIGALLVIVFARAQATYWLARGARSHFAHTRVGLRLDGARMTRATDLLRSRGLILITLSFCTVGFQTAINASAGLIRVPWLTYTLYMLPGCLAWALIYATVGMAAFEAWLLVAASSPRAPWLVLAIVVGVILAWLVRRRVTRTFEESDDGH